MADAFNALLENFRGNEESASDALASVERALGIHFPEDYRDFMARMNGGEGFIGKQYLIAWRVEEIVPFNRDYQVSEFAPGILLIASSGGGEGFGYDFRSDETTIVQVPFIGLILRHAKTVASSFTELLIRMHASHGSLLRNEIQGP